MLIVLLFLQICILYQALFQSQTAHHDTTEESESDVGEGNMLRRTNAFGEPKTTRHNRPPRHKKLLEKREKIATRKK